jgi:uncharacterized protein with PIN domain
MMVSFMAGFLVDQMLMRLGRWLRLLGQDAANPESSDDQELLRRALDEQRTLLTRDRRLAEGCKRAGVQCILIDGSKLEDQLREMEKQGIILELDPQRCTICNSLLKEIESAESKMWRCEGCGKLYWHGSHWTRMQEMLQHIKRDEK